MRLPRKPNRALRYLEPNAVYLADQRSRRRPFRLGFLDEYARRVDVTARGRLPIDHQDGKPSFRRTLGASQAGEPGADDDEIALVIHAGFDRCEQSQDRPASGSGDGQLDPVPSTDRASAAAPIRCRAKWYAVRPLRTPRASAQRKAS